MNINKKERNRKQSRFLMHVAFVILLFFFLVYLEFGRIILLPEDARNFSLEMRRATANVQYAENDVSDIVQKYIPLGSNKKEALAFLERAGYLIKLDVGSFPQEGGGSLPYEIYIATMNRCKFCLFSSVSDVIYLKFSQEVLVSIDATISHLSI